MTTYAEFRGRVLATGMPEDFFRAVLLPEWWQDECEKDDNIVPELELGAARFFAVSYEVIKAGVDIRAALTRPWPTQLAFDRALVLRNWIELDEGIELKGKTLLETGGIRIIAWGADWEPGHEVHFDCHDDGVIVVDLIKNRVPVRSGPFEKMAGPAVKFLKE